MAQSRDKRNRRRSTRVAPPPSTLADERRRRLRRIVLALAIVVGLAGILVATGPADEPNGHAPVG